MDGIEATEVDGVRVYWTRAEVKPFAALMFRVGRVDEPFAQTGITHAAEHLAFHQLGERPFPVNGLVDHVITTFHAGGRADENAAFLTEAALALHDLHTERLSQELQVLRVEAGQRSGSVIDAHFRFRWGTEGPGRAAIGEFGLHRVSPQEILDWVRQRFTRGNAVAWLSFPPPAGFRLPLPEGPRLPVPPRHEISPLPLPSFAPAQVGGVGLGGLVERTSAGASGTRILRSRTERRLRRELGLSYEVSEAYLPLDGREAFTSLYASCRDEAAAQVAGEMIELAEGIARDGATEDELAQDLDAFERAFDDPTARLGELARTAANDLLDHPRASTAELLEELRRVRPGDVAAAMDRCVGGMVGLGAAVPALSGRWQPYPMWSPGVVDGRSFDSVAKKFPWTKGTAVMRTGADGVSLVTPEGQAVTVRYDACAGITRPDANVRVLMGVDGFTLRVDAAEWKNGGAILADIDRAVPPDQQVAFSA